MVKKRHWYAVSLVVVMLAMLAWSQAQAEMTHDSSHMTIQQGGQSAFAAIQEIVDHLMADPTTDWSKVNLESLRQHLIDMDNVTLKAKVSARDIEGGARFDITSDDEKVMASIRAMTLAHAATMNGVGGWQMKAANIPGGALLFVTGSEVQKIRALGFIGVMTVGMHHQTHHLALASGQNPHNH